MTTAVWQRPGDRQADRRVDRTAETQAADAAAMAAAVRGASSTYFWAMRLLPAPRRRAMYALFAFCHELDAIAAEPSPARQFELLAGWRREIAELFDGRPRSPHTRALAGAVRLCGLDRNDFLAIIEGKALDAEIDVRAPSLIELDVHCAQVAVAVGKLAARIHGIAVPVADRLAAEIGRALRLTCILHDLAEDGARQRLYLPRDVLRAHGIDDTDPAVVLSHPALPAVCGALARRAERHYADAEIIMAGLPRHKLRGIRILVAGYRALLGALTARGWTCLDQPISLPLWRKLAIFARYSLLGR